eukprot:g1049.t1
MDGTDQYRSGGSACSAANASCPVMQWIYGGAWILGSDHWKVFDGTQLAKQYGVVVVSSNYRLDTLGWLAVPEARAENPDQAFGNYGLLDQRMALQWTQRNIGKLGGDPGRVTIFGQSAGGFSVCQHLVSPASNGLFSHAIIESGGCDGPWNIFPGADALRFGDVAATLFGCPAGPARMDCLRAKPLKDVMIPYDRWACKTQLHRDTDPWCVNKTAAVTAAAAAASTAGPRPDLKLPAARWPSDVPPFAPLVGLAAVVDGTERGLPDTPLALIRSGRINRSPSGANVTVMLGTNTDEIATFIASAMFVIPGFGLPIGDVDVARVADHVAAYRSRWNASTSTAMQEMYPKERYGTHANRLVAAGTDMCLRCGTRAAARALTAAGIDTYLYHFDFHSDKYIAPSSGRCGLLFEVGCGVGHGQEVAYVFQNAKDKSPAAMNVSVSMGLYWSNLARTGSPNSPAAPVQWPKYDTAADLNLQFADSIGVESGYARDTCDFWDALPREPPYVL